MRVASSCRRFASPPRWPRYIRAKSGSMADNLSRAGKGFAWAGSQLPDRLAAVLERRLQMSNATEGASNPVCGACADSSERRNIVYRRLG